MSLVNSGNIAANCEECNLAEEQAENTIYTGVSKRCGVIFIHKNEDCAIASQMYSFIVVKGRDSNIWSFPKGRMSSDDTTEEECAIRELYEETGIKLETIKGMPRIVIGKNVYFAYHTNRNSYNSFTIHDNYEVGEVCWKNVEELRKLTCNKDLRAIIKYPRYKQSFHKHVYNRDRPRNINKCKIMKVELIKCLEEIMIHNSKFDTPITKSVEIC